MSESFMDRRQEAGMLETILLRADEQIASADYRFL